MPSEPSAISLADELSSLVQCLIAIESECVRLEAQNRSVSVENKVLREQLAAALAEKEVQMQQRQDLLQTHQCCDDKITALRSVAKALESENELLLKEKLCWTKFATGNGMQEAMWKISELQAELRAKDMERLGFLQCFEKLHGDAKDMEQKLDSLQADNEALRLELSNKTDTLSAVRQSKKMVEVQLQGLTEQVDGLQQDRVRLRLEVERLQASLNECSTGVDTLHQELAMQSCVHESKISSMQAELNARLDEMASSNQTDVEQLQHRYVTLFDEKVQECHLLSTQLEAARRKQDEQQRLLTDHEYREQELQTLLHEHQKHHAEQVLTLEHASHQMEQLLCRLREQYDRLQANYMTTLAQFKSSSFYTDTTCRSQDGDEADEPYQVTSGTER